MLLAPIMKRTFLCCGCRRSFSRALPHNACLKGISRVPPVSSSKPESVNKPLRRIFSIPVFLWISLVLATFGGTAPALATGQVEYTLGAGDELRVIVFGQQDLSGKFTIDGRGSISLPLIGSVDAGGKTVREATKAIVAKLKPDYLKNPRVSVQVLNYRPFYILGEVKKPGSYPYVSGMTAVNAVALGGGYTYRARENNIYITRAKDPKREKKKASHDTIVLPGDILEVPERFF
jgi:polysaccharide export outer membrane protein